MWKQLVTECWRQHEPQKRESKTLPCHFMRCGPHTGHMVLVSTWASTQIRRHLMIQPFQHSSWLWPSDRHSCHGHYQQQCLSASHACDGASKEKLEYVLLEVNYAAFAFSTVMLLVGWSEVHTRIWPSWCYCHSFVSCFSKIHTAFSFLAPAYLGSHGQSALKVCVCFVHMTAVYYGLAAQTISADKSD